MEHKGTDLAARYGGNGGDSARTEGERGRGEKRVRIGGITDMSTLDWHGHISLVVYLAGCNLYCPYCHNSSLIPPQSGKEVDVEYIDVRIELMEKYMDSVVICGGEPTLQPKAVAEIVNVAKERDMKVMVNTNCLLPDVVDKLLELPIDAITLDTKKDHLVEFSRTLDICQKYDVEKEVRTTVVPTLTDGPVFVTMVSAMIKGQCDSYFLQQFDNSEDVLDPKFKDIAPPSRGDMLRLGMVAKKHGVRNVFVRTREYGIERVSGKIQTVKSYKRKRKGGRRKSVDVSGYTRIKPR